MSIVSLTANWNYPTLIRVGRGRRNELASLYEALNIHSPLLVTDSNLLHHSMVQSVLGQCPKAGVFSEIKANPTGEQVMAGVKVYQKGQHDGVIALGGGSALDAGKAIALMVGQHRPLWDFEDIGDNWKQVETARMAPVIALPTTAGTGSEVGRASVITDTQHQKKKIIFHPEMMPDCVILDPELTMDLPPHITAATGMDALSHCLEAFCAPGYHPMAEGIAVEGIKLIKKHLPRVLRDGHDMESRTHMLVASMMGATAFQRGLGAMHALAHPLGAIYNAHHGRLNAILMPYVLQANRTAIESKVSFLAKYLEIDKGFEGFFEWIVQLGEELGIEKCLSELGIDEQHAARTATMATEDPSATSNPILFDAAQYQALLKAAIHGDYNYLKTKVAECVKTP